MSFNDDNRVPFFDGFFRGVGITGSLGVIATLALYLYLSPILSKDAFLQFLPMLGFDAFCVIVSALWFHGK